MESLQGIILKEMGLQKPSKIVSQSPKVGQYTKILEHGMNMYHWHSGLTELLGEGQQNSHHFPLCTDLKRFSQ